MALFKKQIIKGKQIGFYTTIPSEVERISAEEKSNYPYVSYNTVEEHLAMMETDDFRHMTIRNLEDSGMAGHIILKGLKNAHRTLEFRRIVIYNKGTGYGREALQLLKKLCFEQIGFHRLWLDVFEENGRAINLYESEGFIREGTLRDSFKDDNGYRSQHIYSILEHEYHSLLKDK